MVPRGTQAEDPKLATNNEPWLPKVIANLCSKCYGYGNRARVERGRIWPPMNVCETLCNI